MSAIQANLDTMSAVVAKLRSAFENMESTRNSADQDMNRLQGDFQSGGATEIYNTWGQFSKTLNDASQLLDQMSRLLDKSRQALQEADEAIARAARI